MPLSRDELGFIIHEIQELDNKGCSCVAVGCCGIPMDEVNIIMEKHVTNKPQLTVEQVKAMILKAQKKLCKQTDKENPKDQSNINYILPVYGMGVLEELLKEIEGAECDKT